MEQISVSVARSDKEYVLRISPQGWVAGPSLFYTVESDVLLTGTLKYILQHSVPMAYAPTGMMRRDDER